MFVCWQRCKPQQLCQVNKMKTHTHSKSMTLGLLLLQPSSATHKYKHTQTQTSAYTQILQSRYAKQQWVREKSWTSRAQKAFRFRANGGNKQQAIKHAAEGVVKANPSPPDLWPPTLSLYRANLGSSTTESKSSKVVGWLAHRRHTIDQTNKEKRRKFDTESEGLSHLQLDFSGCKQTKAVHCISMESH